MTDTTEVERDGAGGAGREQQERGDGSSALRLAMVVAGTVAIGVLGSFTTLAVIGA